MERDALAGPEQHQIGCSTHLGCSKEVIFKNNWPKFRPYSCAVGHTAATPQRTDGRQMIQRTSTKHTDSNQLIAVDVQVLLAYVGRHYVAEDQAIVLAHEPKKNNNVGARQALLMQSCCRHSGAAVSCYSSRQRNAECGVWPSSVRVCQGFIEAFCSFEVCRPSTAMICSWAPPLITLPCWSCTTVDGGASSGW